MVIFIIEVASNVVGLRDLLTSIVDVALPY